MKKIDDNSIDMILCNLPFGTTECKWDSVIDLSLLWEQYNRICKETAAILLFAQTPFDKVLGCSNLKNLRYEWIWEKPLSTGFLNAKKMPLKSHENILVFYNKLPPFNPQKTTLVARKGPCEVYNKIDKPYSYEGSTERYPRLVLEFHHDSKKKKVKEDSYTLLKSLFYFVNTSSRHILMKEI